MPITFAEKVSEKEWSGDRILVLEQIPDRKIKSSTGLVDPRLFKGENRLHAIRGPVGNLWRLKYDSGLVPEEFKQKFTSFENARKFASRYFERRGLQIVDVKNAEST